MRKSVLAVGVAILACLSMEASAAQGAAWVGQGTPNPYLIANYMYGVSCATPNACEAVGAGFEGGWDGATWTTQPDVTAGTGQLNAVSCALANACMAVGSANGGNTAARWDGTNWTLEPLPPGSGTSAISCPTVSFCMAVGGGAAESWDGTTWTIQSLPPGSGTSAVSCPTVSFCMAVGGGAAESWDGTSWSSLPPVPIPIGAGSAELNGVSCTRIARCTGAGDASYPDGSVRPYAARWNGTRWHVMSTQTPPLSLGDPSVYASFASVSCHTAAFCIAVGTRGGPYESGVVFAERWTGGGWQLIPSPFGDQGSVAPAGSVSCTTRTRCEAVGTTASPVSLASFTVGAEYMR